MPSRLLAIVALLLGALVFCAPARAAELWMFGEEGCPWCARWQAEIGPGYPRTTEGKRVPLREVDLHKPLPSPVQFIGAPPRVSPTFVLVDKGREIGRLTGYAGADFFYPLLDELIARLDAGRRTDVPSP